MEPNSVIIRFDQVTEQVYGPVRRIIGFVKAKNMVQLFDAADLEANPREAKAGSVTWDIIESIKDTPEYFPFKTKGVLVGASFYQPLQRNRYQLRFENTKIEGILDGGHNMLAVGSYILSRILNDDRILRRIKTWNDLKDQWEEHADEISKIKKASEADEDDPLDFLVPIEILVPSDLEDDEMVSAFTSSLLDICAARNNNVELTIETRAHKKGFYEDLRKALPPFIANRVEWKSNDGGDIKVRDLIALSWIPMSVIDLPVQIKIPPQNIYRNKGACVKYFDELMSHDDVSKTGDGDYTRELHSSTILSALAIAGQLPLLYDKIYKEFPEHYNNNEGRFGALSVVKMAKNMRSAPTTHFTNQDVEYSYPDGLIMPLVYGLKALMEKDTHGGVKWKTDPERFLNSHLGTIVKKYRVILDAYRADPQKVGKNEGSYDLVLDAFETELLRQEKAVA